MDKQSLIDLSSSIAEKLDFVIQPTRELWNSSKFLRIISIITGSITAFTVTRSIYIRAYRIYYRLPPGPIGPPYIGHSREIGFFDINFFASLATNYGVMSSYFFGPFTSIVINDPKLAKKVYSDKRLLNRMPFVVGTDSFIFANGKMWSERRRMIYSNLMSTMKSSYAEDKTKSFIKNKVFPVFDDDISNNNLTSTKQLFRPMGVNIVLQACFGKELSSLQDPFWLSWDEAVGKVNSTQAQLFMIMFLTGGNNILTRIISNLFVGDTFQANTGKLIDLLDAFNKDTSKDIASNDDVKYDDDVKLFKDYMTNYVNNEEGSKYTERELLGDMMAVLLAATDSTYSVLSFCLILACKYPELQEELYEELNKAFGGDLDNVELQKGGVRKIPKLRAFIHEALRMYPPLPIVGFRCMMDKGFKVEVDENTSYDIPQGALINIGNFAIGRDPKNWIKDYDENKFGDIDMEQVHFEFWLDENGQFVKQKNASSFFAFHYGKRDCIGQTLAMKEIIIVLAMILMKYKVSTKENKSGFDIGIGFSGILNEPEIDSLRFEHRNV